MTRSKQKVVQYLKEARASELALVRVLQSQIAMTPRGPFRTGLEAHLDETRTHASRLAARIGELQHGFNPILFAFGVAETVVGQALALAKTPADLVRGTGGEEKVLKNAKDAAATETLEIATYIALERLATLADDVATAELAVSIRRDEERMLDRILAEIPALTQAVYGADVHGDPSYDVTTTGAADAVRAGADAAGDAADAAKQATKDAAAAAAKKARAARAKAAAKAKAAAEDAEDLAKDAGEAVASGAAKAREAAEQTAEDVSDAPDEDDSADDDAPEIDPDAEKPWAGYDELSVEEVRAVLLTADEEKVRLVDAYERAHEARADVLSVVERHLQGSR